MNRDVLILGNGISRLLYGEFIDQWGGELWACNRAYEEYGQQLDRLTGHVEVMLKAKEERTRQGWKFQLWGGNLGTYGWDQLITCPREFWKDSGTTWVAQALHERRKVWVCGFDLGGMDVHSPGLERCNKTSWVTRWRNIAARWSLRDVTFVGTDHKKFIESDASPLEYTRYYQKGVPHISDPEYLELWSLLNNRPAPVPKVNWEMVAVEWLMGPNAGRSGNFRRDVATILVDKKQVKILEEVVV